MILYVIATDAMQPALSLLVMAEAKTFHFARSTRTCLTEKNQSPRQQPLSAPDRWALCISNAAKSLFHKRQKKRQHCMVLQWFLKYCDRCPQNDLLLSCKPLPLPTLLLTPVLPLPLWRAQKQNKNVRRRRIESGKKRQKTRYTLWNNWYRSKYAFTAELFSFGSMVVLDLFLFSPWQYIRLASLTPKLWSHNFGYLPELQKTTKSTTIRSVCLFHPANSNKYAHSAESIRSRIIFLCGPHVEQSTVRIHIVVVVIGPRPMSFPPHGIRCCY